MKELVNGWTFPYFKWKYRFKAYVYLCIFRRASLIYHFHQWTKCRPLSPSVWWEPWLPPGSVSPAEPSASPPQDTPTWGVMGTQSQLPHWAPSALHAHFRGWNPSWLLSSSSSHVSPSHRFYFPIPQQSCSFLIVHAFVLNWFSRVRLFVTPWTVARQAPLSLGFSRQEHWSGCHFLLQGIFLTQESNLRHLHLLHWQVGSSPLAPQWEAPLTKSRSMVVHFMCQLDWVMVPRYLLKYNSRCFWGGVFCFFFFFSDEVSI